LAIERIKSMLELSPTEQALFPPTILYNEGWMLRLVLDWFNNHQIDNHYLSIPHNGRWYSEALLPSAFLRRSLDKKNGLAERETHADGVIGHFTFVQSGTAIASLTKDAGHFVVVEAKMSSGLSTGVKNAGYYNQAARSVACMAEVICRANIDPKKMSSLGFYVVAPKDKIDNDTFTELVSIDSILSIVKRRVSEYGGEKDDWFHDWFIPTIEKIVIDTISWEDVIATITRIDSVSGQELSEFYDVCLKFNPLQKRANMAK
jgi:hypothetical protein